MMMNLFQSKKIKVNYFLILTILLSSFSIYAQAPKDELLLNQLRYPNEYYLYSTRNKVYQINIVNGALKITAQTEEALMILKELATRSTEETVEYTPLFALSNLEAYTLVPAGNKYKKVSIGEVKDRHKFDRSIFHDDINEKVFDYQELQVGAKRYLKYTTTYLDPKMLNGYFFGYNVPTDHVFFQVEVDNAVELGYKEFNTENYPIKLNIEKQKTKTIYTWTCDTMPKTTFFDNSPSFRSIIPHIEIFIKKYTVDGKEVRMLENVEDLHRYYAAFLKDLNVEISPALKALTDSLVAGKSDEIERLKSIFYWVKGNIKYIAFEDGYGGYIPRQASDVCDKKYGDCKDMASITHAMLQYAGIQNAYLTWIGTRDIPYTYEALPTGAVDNHMIVTYETKDSTYFLDATSEHTPFGYPTEFIQGKEAMLHIDSTHFEIVKVPEIPASKNVYEDSVYLVLKRDTIVGEGLATITGYVRNYYLDINYDLTGDEKLKAVKSFLEKGNNKFYLDHFTEFNKTDRDKALGIQYSFLLNNYSIQSGNDQFINLFLEKPMMGSKIDNDRKADIEYDYKDIYRYTVVLEIPEGYKAKYIAPPSNLKNDSYSFSSEFRVFNNTIILKYEIQVNTLLLKQSQFEDYNNLFAFLKKQYSENISITKK